MREEAEIGTLKVVKTNCEICPKCCGIAIHVEDGKVIKIEGMRNHPANRGALCVRSSAAKELLYHPARLKYPLRRIGKKGAGKFERITWDEALSTVAKKLLMYREKYGPQSVLFYRGLTFGYISLFVNRLANAFGSPNFICESNICVTEGRLAEELTYGQRGLKSGMRNAIELDNVWQRSDFLIIWGSNPVVSEHPIPKAILHGKKKGVRIVVIDPRFTETAERADIWVPIRPGTDGALALGMMNVIISEELYSKDFVKEWTVGFDELRRLVESYPPNKVENITGVSSEMIIRIAREYAKAKAAAIHNCNFHNTNGFYTYRAISCLQAITGHIDVPGGDIWPMSGPIKRKDLRLHGMLPSGSPPAIGEDKFGLYCRHFKWGQAMVMANAILSQEPYAIKAFLEFHGNAMMWPNSNRFFRALKKLDLHVVVNLFMTPSARLADVVLPATTFLERVGANSGTDSYAFLPQPAVEPMFECWSDYEIIFELAKRMNLGKYFWDDIEDAIEEELKPSGISVQNLKANPDGIIFPKPPMKYRKYEERGFQTPSGKVELYSDTLKKHGYNPLPIYLEPEESSRKKPRLAKKYPLALITGEKMRMYTHSTLRNIPSKRKLCPNPFVRINVKDAAERGIKNGNLVIVKSPRGSIKLAAKVTERIMQGVVSIPHGWEQANANTLTDDDRLDPISGFPPYRGALCEVKKI